MLFDKLCGLAERHLRNLIPILENAALFYFEGKPHDFLSKAKDEINFNEADKLFQLPFPVTAIEDDSSLVLLADSKENQIGLEGTRYFVDIINMNTDSSYFVNHLGCEEELKIHKELAKQQIEEGYFISKGQIRELECNEDGTIRCAGIVDHAYFLNNKKVFFSGSDHVLANIADKKYIDDMLRNPMTAYEELILLSNPKYFILEESPVRESKKAKKGKKIPRSHDRSLYVHLKPNEIRRRLSIERPAEQTRNSPVPHERRRHLRRLRKESGYKEDRIIPVKASWIGTSEKVIGNRKYKVRLDL